MAAWVGTATGEDDDVAHRPTNRWLAETGGARGAAYAARFDELAASGADLHGEARFVDALVARASRVVDAGCGTGRVAAELARQGHRPTGVDLDGSMLAEARRRDPDLPWLEADLLDVTEEQLGSPVDCVLLAGNVVVYLTPGTEAEVVARTASWLRPGGLLVAGFAADRHVSRHEYRTWCSAAGLEPAASHAGWEGGPDDDGPYTVQVHRRPGSPAGPA